VETAAKNRVAGKEKVINLYLTEDQKNNFHLELLLQNIFIYSPSNTLGKNNLEF